MYKNSGTHNYYNTCIGFNSKLKSLQHFILFGKCPCYRHSCDSGQTYRPIYTCILLFIVNSVISMYIRYVWNV